MTLLRITNVEKSFGANEILRDINLQVDSGEKAGLIGLNGVGKSTLLKIISGDIFPDRGSVYIARGCQVGHLTQGSPLENESTVLSVLEAPFKDLFRLKSYLRNLEIKISCPDIFNDERKLKQFLKEYADLSEKFKSSGGYEVDSRIRGVLKGLGFKNPDRQVASLSGGQKTRLALGRLLLQAPDLLLLDEPTNYLDIATVEWLEGFLRDYPGAFLVVSHDRFFLDNTVDTIFELTQGQIFTYPGNYSKFLKDKEVEIQLQEKHENLQKKEVERLKKNIQTFISHRNYAQARVRQRRLEELTPKTEALKPDTLPLKLQFTSAETGGREVLHLMDLGFSYGNHEIFKDVNLSVFRGERIGIIGPNGIGKSTLLKVIDGQLSPVQGTVSLGHKIKCVYLSQEHEDLSEDATILQEVWNVAPHLTHTEVRNFLGGMLFSGDDVEKNIHVLSGGERSRVSLAKAILQGANVLLLDEPTNHLDLQSKEMLEKALLNYDGTIISVSHDRYFLTKVATRIWEFTPDSIEDLAGGYKYYLQKKAQANLVDDVHTSENKTKAQKAKARERIRRQEERKRQLRFEEIENSILSKEVQVEEVELLMCQPEVYSDPDKAFKVNKRYQELIKELEELYDELDDY